MMCSTLHAVFVTLLIRPLHSFSPNGLIRPSSRCWSTLAGHNANKNTQPSSVRTRPATLWATTPRLDYSSSGRSNGMKRKTKRDPTNKEPQLWTKSNRFHPRNAFQGSYDMERLCLYHAELKPFLRPGHASKQQRSSALTTTTIDFSDPLAVRALNAALLSADYGISKWASFLPPTSLIPPIPGRADYIHHVADVLASSKSGGTSATAKDTHATTRTLENRHAHHNRTTTIDPSMIPMGPSIRGLDIGTGASLIYPLLGTQTYGWSFLATDVDPTSVASARTIGAAHHHDLGTTVAGQTRTNTAMIDIRLQRHKQNILKHVLTDDDERIDFVMCNPPFYESAAAYQKENARKVRNLAANARKRQAQTSFGDDKKEPNAMTKARNSSIGSNNFGGGPSELWYPGGEVAFIGKMMEESSLEGGPLWKNCLWFSSLVSRRDNLPKLIQILESKKVKDMRIIPMGQGGLKTSQILFWSFHDREEQRAWFRE